MIVRLQVNDSSIGPHSDYRIEQSLKAIAIPLPLTFAKSSLSTRLSLRRMPLQLKLTFRANGVLKELFTHRRELIMVLVAQHMIPLENLDTGLPLMDLHSVSPSTLRLLTLEPIPFPCPFGSIRRARTSTFSMWMAFQSRLPLV